MLQLNKLWYERSAISILLTPFSLIYRILMATRRLAYRLRLFKTTRFSVPIIIVGNITVGGSGKTPAVIALVKWLQQQGWKPGVISRGYRGEAGAWPQHVTANTDPMLVGDEPVLIAEKTRCPVVVGPNRTQDVRSLLARYECNVIVSDDGLQHYALARDIEIAVIKSGLELGNERCLPAGPLREPKKRLKKVDFVIHNGGQQGGYYSMTLMPGRIYNVRYPQETLDPREVRTPVHAIAAIAHPQFFFMTLRGMGLTVQGHPYPDHSFFRHADFSFSDHYPIIMTEKDKVKCQQWVSSNCYALEAEYQLDAGLLHAIERRLQELSQRRR